MEGVDRTKSSFMGLSCPAAKETFYIIPSQTHAGRGLQYHVEQIPAGVITTLHNEVIPRI